MSWETARKYSRKKCKQPKITISTKTNTLYFNSYIRNHILGDREKIIARYNKESKMMAFQPIYAYEGDKMEVYKVNYPNTSRHRGALMSINNILSQFDVEIKERTTFIAEWKPKIEWLIINLNDNGGDNNVSI